MYAITGTPKWMNCQHDFPGQAYCHVIMSQNFFLLILSSDSDKKWNVETVALQTDLFTRMRVPSFALLSTMSQTARVKCTSFKRHYQAFDTGNMDEQIRPESYTLSFESFQVQNVKCKIGSHKHLSIEWPSYWFIDGHPSRPCRTWFTAKEPEMCFCDSFLLHHKVQGEIYILYIY